MRIINHHTQATGRQYHATRPQNVTVYLDDTGRIWFSDEVRNIDGTLHDLEFGKAITSSEALWKFAMEQYDDLEYTPVAPQAIQEVKDALPYSKDILVIRYRQFREQPQYRIETECNGDRHCYMDWQYGPKDDPSWRPTYRQACDRFGTPCKVELKFD